MARTIRDANGKAVRRDVRREPDGTWSAVVWFGGGMGPATHVRRQYGYWTRQEARDASVCDANGGTAE